MTKQAQTEKTPNRDLTKVQAHFKDVLIASGVAFVTVEGDIRQVQRKMVEDSGLRVNKRTDFQKQSTDLAIKALRSMFGLKGSHLEINFLAKEGDKMVDARGKEVIHFQAATPAA